MSNRNPNFSEHAAIPVFSPVGLPNIFGDSDARFAVGQIATSSTGPMPVNGYEHGTSALANFPGVVVDGLEPIVEAYGILRAKTYIDLTQMLGPEFRNSQGADWNLDDARSDHFVTVERVSADDDTVRETVYHHNIESDENGFVFRLPNCLRVIKKSALHPGKLPIEEFFPEAINPLNNKSTFPAPIGSVELSRKIALHEEPRTKAALSMPMFTEAIKYGIRNNLGPAYATVEEFYETIFRKQGFPVVRIADPKYVGEYADDNLGIKINYLRLAGMLGISATEQIPSTAKQFTLHGTVSVPQRI